MVWLLAWCLLVLGLVFLARSAEATEFIRRWIKRRADEGRAVCPDLWALVPVGSEPKRMCMISRFFDSLLSCAPCVAAWSAIPAAALVVGLYLLRDSPWFVVMLAASCPFGAVGLMYGFTLLSPSQAMAAALAGLSRLKGKKDAEGKTQAG
jgi:hypothetical protein